MTGLRVRAPLALGTLLLASTAAGQAQTATPWSDPSPHTVRFVDLAPDVRLEVLDWGGTGRDVVLLTGSGHTAHVYDEFATKLKGFATSTGSPGAAMARRACPRPATTSRRSRRTCGP